MSWKCPMYLPPVPKANAFFKHQCNEKIFIKIVGTPQEPNRVTTIEEWWWMTKKFIILFGFITEKSYWSKSLHPLAARVPGLSPGIRQQKNI